jgi:integrator complex subunit 10
LSGPVYCLIIVSFLFWKRLQQFQGDSDLWNEVETLTRALRSDCGDPEPTFLRSVFANLSTGKLQNFLNCVFFFFSLLIVFIVSDAQQQLLQVTADRSNDTMEHCRLLMLLLSRFPHAVAKHGVRGNNNCKIHFACL